MLDLYVMYMCTHGRTAMRSLLVCQPVSPAVAYIVQYLYQQLIIR